MSLKNLRRAALLALSLTLFCLSFALAEEAADPTRIPQPGPAATRTTAPLLASPQKSGKVLMTYYPGTRVQVVRQDSPGYVRVNVGVQPGTLTGFMRVDDLAFTEAGVRSLPGVLFSCALDGTLPVYRYPDEQSEKLGEWFGISLLGVREDGWAHVSGDDNALPSEATGFCFIGLTPELNTQPIDFVHTLPAEGEMPFEEAISRAREILIREAPPCGDGSGEPVTAEGLDACQTKIQAFWYAHDQSLWVHVDFRQASGDFLYASLDMKIDGGEIAEYSFGNG